MDERIRKRLWTRGVGLALTCLLVWVVLFQLLRLLLLTANWDLAADAPARVLLWSFVVGLRFDLALAAWLMLPLILLAGIAQRTRGTAARNRVLLGATMLLGSVVTILGVAEVEFYREFYTRYNSLALHYWSQPATVLSMLWHGFPVIRYLALALALLAAFMLAIGRAIRFWSPQPGQNGIAKPQAASFRLRFRNHLAWTLMVPLLVVAARGGVRGSPLEWGDAIHSESTFANHLALNGLWTLCKAAREAGRG